MFLDKVYNFDEFKNNFQNHICKIDLSSAIDSSKISEKKKGKMNLKHSKTHSF